MGGSLDCDFTQLLYITMLTPTTITVDTHITNEKIHLNGNIISKLSPYLGLKSPTKPNDNVRIPFVNPQKNEHLGSKVEGPIG